MLLRLIIQAFLVLVFLDGLSIREAGIAARRKKSFPLVSYRRLLAFTTS